MKRSSFLHSIMPYSLRRQFLMAVSILILLILSGGVTAVYTLHTSAQTIQQLADKRLNQMQEAQDLMQKTLLIERMSYQLKETDNIHDMLSSYEKILYQLTKFDTLVNQLASDSQSGTLLELHRSSQLFRNTVNIAAQLCEKELRTSNDFSLTTSSVSKQNCLSKLYNQAKSLMDATQLQSEYFMNNYREAVHMLNTLSQHNIKWITLLILSSLVVALSVAWWFLGWHVLGRLQKISHDLRSSDPSSATKKAALKTDKYTKAKLQDEIEEMAYAVKLYQEDRRQLAKRTLELLQARDAAEAANKAKSLFLASMSHELRTPLNAILGFSNILHLDPNTNEEQQQNIDIINRSGAHLLTLINDVLEIAKIESGKLELEISPFDLVNMVQNVYEMMNLRAEQKGIELSLELSPKVPQYIQGDEARLRQVLVNLVGNAIKFTKKGKVTIYLSTKDNNRQHLLIEVKDTGPGITIEDQKLLFQPFVQLSEGVSKGGTGLGLSISKQFINLMNGDITIQSNVGKGSSFRIDLPLIIADEKDMHSLQIKEYKEVIGLKPGQKNYRILVAEDQYENRLLLTQLMDKIGLETKIAKNGEECVRIFEEWHPDLIWMDRQMPVMDGVEATKQIRKLPYGDSVKIVAVTASVFKEQKTELEAAGMDGFVNKPYHPNDIYDSLAQLLDMKFIYQSTKAQKEHTSTSFNLEKLSIVSKELRDELRMALESLNSKDISKTIKKITQLDEELGTALLELANSFNYPQILSALKKLDK